MLRANWTFKIRDNIHTLQHSSLRV